MTNRYYFSFVYTVITYVRVTWFFFFFNEIVCYWSRLVGETDENSENHNSLCDLLCVTFHDYISLLSTIQLLHIYWTHMYQAHKIMHLFPLAKTWRNLIHCNNIRRSSLSILTYNGGSLSERLRRTFLPLTFLFPKAISRLNGNYDITQ